MESIVGWMCPFAKIDHFTPTPKKKNKTKNPPPQRHKQNLVVAHVQSEPSLQSRHLRRFVTHCHSPTNHRENGGTYWDGTLNTQPHVHHVYIYI